MLVKDKYLLLLGALTLIINWVNSSGEYILDRTLVKAAAVVPAGQDATKYTEQFIANFKADYFLWVNVAGVVLQLFVVSRVIKYLGLRAALFVMPIVSLAGYSVIAVLPVLHLIMGVKIAENSLDYSLENVSRQALWLITSRDAKYKAKSVIDTFIVRAGDVCSAAVVWIGTSLGFDTRHFIMVNVVMAVAWLGVVLLLTREHKKRDHEGAAAALPGEPVPA